MKLGLFLILKYQRSIQKVMKVAFSSWKLEKEGRKKGGKKQRVGRKKTDENCRETVEKRQNITRFRLKEGIREKKGILKF